MMTQPVWCSNVFKDFTVFSHSLQWKEANLTWLNGTVTQVLKSCNVDGPTDSWIRTPFLDVEGLNRVYITISFITRRCHIETDPSSAKACKESFNLYYREADRNDSTHILQFS